MALNTDHVHPTLARNSKVSKHCFMKKTWLSLIKVGDYCSVAGFWVGVWLYRVLLITLLGGIVGVLVTPFTKLLFFEETPWLELIGGAFRIGCQYANMWSIAIAMIWVVMDRKEIMGRTSRFFISRQQI